MKPKSYEFTFAKHMDEPTAPSEATLRALEAALGKAPVYTKGASVKAEDRKLRPTAKH
jgi:hypothetical protein